MFIRLTFLLLLSLLVLTPCAHCAPLDDWNALIVVGSKQKFDGNYDGASQSFIKAVTFAEKQKLPNKCLPISLCRLAESQLNANKVKEADSHFDRITNLIKTQKASNKLDSQLSFWGAALADAYLSNHKPETRELCLKHACYLKTLVYGASHRNSTDCLNKLAEYYIETDKVDKGLKILEVTEGLIAKQVGKSSDRYGMVLNNVAVNCEKGHKYNQAKQLELEVIKIAQTNKSILSSGLPAFYCLLSMNALAQDKESNSKDYSKRSIHECSKIANQKQKDQLLTFLNPLAEISQDDAIDKRWKLAIAEFKEVLKIHQKVKTHLDTQFFIYTHLAGAVAMENKADYKEALVYLQKCIDIASPPKNIFHGQLSDLYMRKGCTISDHDWKKANECFSQALSLSKDSQGYQGGLILYFWGCVLSHDGSQQKMACEKFNLAYKQVSKLPPEKRGTVLADLLQQLALHQLTFGKKPQADLTFKRFREEIELQKKLKTPLVGPDSYHPLY